jgi:ribulose-bisphosphate carboxylase large chain
VAERLNGHGLGPTAGAGAAGSDRIVATYLIETAHPLEKAAEIMAGEQSTGTFIRVPGETEEMRERHGARIEALTPLETFDTPSLPHATVPRAKGNGHGAGTPRYQRARVVLSFPLANMGPSLPNLLATVMGNLFELREFSGLRLIDLELPPAFADVYLGPQFGIAGTRRLAGVTGRPLIGTIVKPSVGMGPEATAALAQKLAEAGLDFIKDDELQANGPHCPFDARVDAVMRVLNAHADRTGKKVMYAFNITDELDEMRRHHDKVLASGGTCVMVSMNSIGLPAAHVVRKHSAMPIHGHRNGWGMFTRSPLLGIEYVAFQKLWRLVGMDHLHCNGLRNKFWEPDESVLASARACVTPLFAGLPPGRADYVAMPVLSSAQWAGQAPETFARLRSTDLLYVCGGGIIGHPGGIAAGVASVVQAWEAATSGAPLEEHARRHPELRQALDHYANL